MKDKQIDNGGEMKKEERIRGVLLKKEETQEE